jgi:hypothetical protein
MGRRIDAEREAAGDDETRCGKVARDFPRDARAGRGGMAAADDGELWLPQQCDVAERMQQRRRIRQCGELRRIGGIRACQQLRAGRGRRGSGGIALVHASSVKAKGPRIAGPFCRVWRETRIVYGVRTRSAMRTGTVAFTIRP